MSRSVKTPHSVIAAVRDETAFRAVALRKRNEVVEVLWTRSMSAEEGSWERFAAECGLGAGSKASRREAQAGHVSVVGLDATAVAFYRIDAPNVGRDEIAAIVRMQAESLLPLPASQIEVAWRTASSTNGTTDVTIAAARRDFLHRFVEQVRTFAPQLVVPGCEGTARAWHELFGDRERQAAIVNVGAQHTQVCLVLNGAVVHSAVLDMGKTDLSVLDGQSEESAEATAPLERFAQDMRTVLTSFGWSESGRWPVCILSNGDEEYERLAEALRTAGVESRVSMPQPQKLGMPVGLEPGDVHRYREPLGLGLMALDGPAQGLDLLGGIRAAERQKKARSSWCSTALAAVAALIMLATFLGVSYATDVFSERRLTALVAQPAFKEASERQRLLGTVAQHRPDLLGLLTDTQSGQNDGILLETFHFRKGQTVTVTGQADNSEQLWKYQANLLANSHIKDVDITNTSTDSKTKKINFTMVFHYKNFTSKAAAL